MHYAKLRLVPFLDIVILDLPNQAYLGLLINILIEGGGVWGERCMGGIAQW